MADAESGYTQPNTPNLYLDAETTGRTGTTGADILRQRVVDPDAVTALESIISALGDLPTSGLATSAEQASLLTALAPKLEVADLAVVAQETTQADILTALQGVLDVTVSNPFDGNITDRAGRLLGHVTVDNFPSALDLSALATAAKQDTQTGHLSTIAGKDFATQTTLAAILAKIIAAPATEAKQDTANTSLASILASVDGLEGFTDGIEGALTTLNAKDFATQTTLAAILAKIIAAPATEAKQDTANTSLASILSSVDGLEGFTDGIEGALTTLNGKDFATQTTLAAILAKLIAAPATEAKQDTQITALGTLATESKLEAVRALLAGTLTVDTELSAAGPLATQTTLASVLTALQGTLTVDTELSAAGPLATQTTLASVLSALQGTLTVDTELSAAGPLATQTTLAAIAGQLPSALVSNRLDVNIGASTALDVKAAAQTTGGATPYKLNSAASTNATVVKNSAGTVYSIQVFNTNASARYLKFYDKATSPTVGSDTPVKVIVIPGNAAGSGVVIPTGLPGTAFANGISFALTTGAPDTDTGAVALNEIIVNMDYK